MLEFAGDYAGRPKLANNRLIIDLDELTTRDYVKICDTRVKIGDT